MHVIADYCINPAVHHPSGVDCMPAAGVWATVVLIPTSYTERCVFLTALSPSFLLPVRGSCHPVAPAPFVFQNVSHPLSLCSSSSIPPLPLLCPCLFLSLCRTPNVSSNGNPGYESLPLTDRQSPPPSVSSSVLVAPSQSVPFYHTLALIISSSRTNVAARLQPCRTLWAGLLFILLMLQSKIRRKRFKFHCLH